MSEKIKGTSIQIMLIIIAGLLGCIFYTITAYCTNIINNQQAFKQNQEQIISSTQEIKDILELWELDD